MIKTLSIIAIAASVLAGCAVVPYEPAPAVYAAPPAVVVQPYAYYGYYGGWRGHRHWR
ncbi:MAG TPA: hypothetical protein VI321_01850 [Burkholderiales bacterium]